MKKAVSGTALILLSIGMLTLIFSVQPVRADSGTIYIKADGSVEGTTYIVTADNITYVFTANISDSIVVERDNIIVDGNGSALQGAQGSGTGIDLSGTTNVTVKNTQIEGFDLGIQLNFSSCDIISGNVVTANNFYVSTGISVVSSSSNTISGNTVATSNGDGIRLYSSSSNIVCGNIATNNWRGIELDTSSNNTLVDNIMANNTYNFGVDGLALSDFENDVDTSNTVDGKPVYYWVNRLDTTVPSDAGTVVLANCTGITAQNLNLKSSFCGMLMAYTTNSTITKNNMTNNARGIWLISCTNDSILANNMALSTWNSIRLDYSSTIRISGNNVSDNDQCIWLETSSNNVISGNNITHDNGTGTVLYYCSNNVISGNNVSDIVQGIDLEYCSSNFISGNSANCTLDGIRLGFSSNNRISGNNITDNYRGIELENSSYNIISQNNITANIKTGVCALSLYSSSSGNKIYHNFIGKGQYVFFETAHMNAWDNGYPSGGNYWGSYTGVDLYSGPYQNETGSDGIGDTPFLGDANNTDRYPLMKPYIPLLCDMNDDRTVDMKDVAIAAKAFGSYLGHPRWNPQADINQDDKIDILDMALIARNFGKHDP